MWGLVGAERVGMDICAVVKGCVGRRVLCIVDEIIT